MGKIFKTGHSLAVTVSKKLLKEAGLSLGSEIKIEFDPQKNNLILKAAIKNSQLALNIKSRPKLGNRV